MIKAIKNLTIVSLAFLGEIIDDWLEKPYLENRITELLTINEELAAKNNILQNKIEDLEYYLKSSKKINYL